MNLETHFVKNRIKDILLQRGFEEFKPTDKLLNDLNITRKSFFMVINNKLEPTFGQCLLFAKWLNVTLYDLYNENDLVKNNI